MFMKHKKKEIYELYIYNHTYWHNVMHCEYNYLVIADRKTQTPYRFTIHINIFKAQQ